MKSVRNSAEFKAEDIKQIAEPGDGMVQVSKHLGVSDNSLHAWLKQAAFSAVLILFSAIANAAIIPDVPKADGVLYKVFSSDDKKHSFQGSGVAVATDKILTNCHIVADATRVIAVDLKGIRYDVTGVSADAYHDACTIRVSKPLPRYAGQARFTAKGDTVYAIGFPDGQFTWSKGKVTNPEFKLGGEDTIRSSTYCAPGISGGALLNADGDLVGLLFAGRADACVAVPTYLLQRSISGSFLSLGTGAPRAEVGSAYHSSW